MKTTFNLSRGVLFANLKLGYKEANEKYDPPHNYS